MPSGIQRIKYYIKWALQGVRFKPKREIFFFLKHRKNLKNFALIKALRTQGIDGHIAGWNQHSIPKHIWIYWEQGIENAPTIVKECYNSWLEKNHAWEVRLLDGASIKRFVDIDGFSNLSVQARSDVLRLQLLKKYGGVWADATVYCHRPLDEWLPLASQSGLFLFSDPAEDRIIESWFIASSQENVAVAKWLEEIISLAKHFRRGHPTYFFCFYLFDWLTKNNRDVKQVYANSAKIPAKPAFLLLACLKNMANPNTFAMSLASGYPVSKLDWRYEFDREKFLALLASAGANVSKISPQICSPKAAI